MKRTLLFILLLLALPTIAMAGDGTIGTKVKMTAVILSVGDGLSVEVTDSEYTFGVHTVIVGEATKYVDSCGKKISYEDLKVGDRVEIFYNGQVMMSYPPKIVARKIVRIS